MAATGSRFFLRIHPMQRILLSIVVSAAVFAFTIEVHVSELLRVMLLWDVFAATFLLTSITICFSRSVEHIRRYARQEDGSRFFAFLMILVSSFASMVLLALLIVSKDRAVTQAAIYLPVIIAGILLSWAMVHLMFTFHYAHRYYGDDEQEEKAADGEKPLNFPGDDDPDYLDFMYFSFVIGMTFQVSDVEIQSKVIRRLALVHGLLAFLLNTFVVALTINIIAGLGK